ncbi:MAG: hypothetical protein WAN35_15255 [Terracidiphilus sp.]
MISNSASLSRTHRVLAEVLVVALGVALSQTVCGQIAATTAQPRGISASGAPVMGVGPVSAASHDPAALASVATAKPTNSQRGSGEFYQGVKMHGHWIIDVKNPDGTLVEHRDFENALEGGGQGFLVGLMSGYLTPGNYMIVMGPQSGNGACVATFQWCGIVTSLTTYPGAGYCGNYYCATGLTVTPNLGSGGLNTGPFSLVLAGSITANQTGTIGSVYSLISTCANIAYSSTVNPSTLETNSPASCVTQTSPEPWYGPLSQANITPIAVNSGQIVQVTVTISFS